MAGQSEAGRTLSSPQSQKAYLFEIIEFIYKPLWRSRTFLTEKYIENGLSIAQIAAETLSSRATIRRALIGFKIPIKEKGNPGLRPAQAPYGFRKQKGLLVPHMAEQQVIESIRKMSGSGIPYRKICEFLTGIGVPTKNRGRGWHPEMIRRILNKHQKPI